MAMQRLSMIRAEDAMSCKVSYLPSDGEGLRSVGRAGNLERGPLGHLLLRVDDHRLARARTTIC